MWKMYPSRTNGLGSFTKFRPWLSIQNMTEPVCWSRMWHTLPQKVSLSVVIDAASQNHWCSVIFNPIPSIILCSIPFKRFAESGRSPITYPWHIFAGVEWLQLSCTGRFLQVWGFLQCAVDNFLALQNWKVIFNCCRSRINSFQISAELENTRIGALNGLHDRRQLLYSLWFLLIVTPLSHSAHFTIAYFETRPRAASLAPKQNMHCISHVKILQFQKSSSFDSCITPRAAREGKRSRHKYFSIAWSAERIDTLITAVLSWCLTVVSTYRYFSSFKQAKAAVVPNDPSFKKETFAAFETMNCLSGA